MKTHQRLCAVAVLFLVSGTVHAQVTQILPGLSVDLDTVRITPELHWIVDSTCIAIEVEEHENLLAKYEKMPDYYFDNLNKRIKADHIITREELVAYEKDKVSAAKNKFPIYRKLFETASLAKK
jgi:hypothetical protein